MNLCTNANHAMEKTGGILEVILDQINTADKKAGIHLDLPPGTWVRLSISDNQSARHYNLNRLPFAHAL